MFTRRAGSTSFTTILSAISCVNLLFRAPRLLLSHIFEDRLHPVAESRPHRTTLPAHIQVSYVKDTVSLQKVIGRVVFQGLSFLPLVVKMTTHTQYQSISPFSCNLFIFEA